MFYIAEIGWNFMGDMKLAEKMISAASYSGATHVKFQYWREDKLKKGEWDKDGRREIYLAAQLDEGKINSIIEISNKNKINAFFSVFNKEDAVFIKNYNQKIIKIPSHEIYNLELIDYCLSNFDTVLISAGACTKNELHEAVKKINLSDCKTILMHCVSTYPCPSENVNLKRLEYLKSIIVNSELGLSDHSSSLVIPSVAAIYNIKAIEKHFTIDNDLPGRDNKFALLPNQFEKMVKNHKEVLLGLIDHGVDYQECEKNTVKNYRGRWG